MSSVLVLSGSPARESRPVALRWLAAIGTAAKRKPLGAIGGAIIIVLLVVMLFAPLIAPYDPNSTSITARFQSPNGDHLFGTDSLGRDLFSQIVMGSRTSLAVGFGAMGLGLLFATLLGLTAYFGNKIDIVTQRLVDIGMGFPGIILLLAIMSVLGLGVSKVILALGIWTAFAPSRIVRASVLGVRAAPYIEAARAVGAGETRIVLRYVLPNITPVLIVIGSLSVGSAILAEAAISYLGYGVPPPAPSWGRLVQSNVLQARNAPWLTIIPGVVITITVFSFNVLGDALRDLLDPRLRT